MPKVFSNLFVKDTRILDLLIMNTLKLIINTVWYVYAF